MVFVIVIQLWHLWHVRDLNFFITQINNKMFLFFFPITINVKWFELSKYVSSICSLNYVFDERMLKAFDSFYEFLRMIFPIFPQNNNFLS